MLPDKRFDYIFADLSAPFTGDGEVKVLPKGNKPKYVTARTVMNRLDNVLGPQNWWDDYVPYSEHAIICRLTIRLPDGSTLTKVDAGGMAGMSDQGDDDKSGFSDAFKRAAVKFGIARYLRGDGVPDYQPRPEDGSHGTGAELGTGQVAPWQNEEQGIPTKPHTIQDEQTQEEPGQVEAEPESKGVNGNPFKADRTFWNDILDEVARTNAGWLADNPDSEEIVTTTRVLMALAGITFDQKVQPVDPLVNMAPDKTPMTEARWAGVMNKVARKSPEMHDWLKQHLFFFCQSQVQAARAIEKRGTRGPR